MALFRWLALPVIIGSIMVGFSFVNGPEDGLIDKLAAKRVAAAQHELLPPTEAHVSLQALPTDTPTAGVVATDTAQVPGSTSTPVPTDTPTPTQAVATGTPAISTYTPTPVQTATPIGTDTPTATGTPTPTASVTGTPTDIATATPTAVSTIIDANGGQITTADGHATLAFPAGATDQRLLIQLATKVGDFPAAPGPEHFLSTWAFDATAIDNGNAAVHQFNSNFTVDLRYTSDQLFGLDEYMIHYMTLDEATRTWVEAPVQWIEPYHWRVTINHFSTQAAGSDGKITLPPILDQAQVNLNTGAATFNLPINVPSGPGGLEPALNVTYNSQRVDETDNGAVYHTVPPSWVGVGWDVAAPAITRSGDRYFLNLNGAGGEIVPTGVGVYGTRNQRFLSITRCSNVESACWTVQDKAGRTYTFGSDAQSLRHYPSANGLNFLDRYYQWDLSTVTDLHGNGAIYTYDQTIGTLDVNIPRYVISSYLKSVTYPGGKIEFNLRTNDLVNSTTMRVDAPQNSAPILVRPDVKDCGSYAQMVFETRALESIVVKTFDTDVYYPSASYVFNSTKPAGVTTCDSSSLRLDSVELDGRDNNSVLTSPWFEYDSPARRRAIDCGGSWNPITNLRLTKIHNGFGGETDFGYGGQITPSCPSVSPLSRYTVQSKTEKGGTAFASTSPDLVLTYQYTDGPHFALDPDRYQSYSYTGYRTVDVRDATSNKTTHTFMTGDETATATPICGGLLPPCTPTPSPIQLAGAETSLVVRDAADHLLSSDYNTYSWEDAIVPTQTPWSGNRPQAYVTHLTRTDSFAVGKTNSRRDYQYNAPTASTAPGELNRVTDTDLTTNACRQMTTSYVAHTGTPYLVLPQTQQTQTCDATPTLLAETVTFYDGSGTTGASPTVGNVTAVRQLADPTLTIHPYVYTFHSYYPNGEPKETSVPIYGTSTLSPTAPTADGIVPQDHGRTLTEYDPASMPTLTGPTGRLVSRQTVFIYDQNGYAPSPVPTAVTSYTYDSPSRRLSKPKLITAPNGLVTGMLYDEFGRVMKQWRQPDSTEASPETTYDYSGWAGGVGQISDGTNYTTVSHVLPGGSTSDLYCVDGLGRSEQKVAPNGSGYSRSVNIYDTRGLVTNSHLLASSSFACSVGETGIGTTPNNIVEHDALGNVLTATNSAPGAPTPCPLVNSVQACTRVTRSAMTTTTTDPRGNKKDSVVDGFGRVIATHDYANPADTTPYSTTTFAYDRLDRLQTVTDNAGNVTTMTYDNLGRKKTMVDPDMSGYNGSGQRIAWTYAYDAAGNLTTQTDARGVTTSIAYDSLGRPVSKTYALPSSPDIPIQGTGQVTYRYDTYDRAGTNPCSASADATAIGRLTVIDVAGVPSTTKTIAGYTYAIPATGGGRTSWCYDNRGRELKKTYVINDSTTPNDTACAVRPPRTLSVGHTYDSSDRISTLTYPDSEVVSYNYADSAAGGGKLAGMYSSLGTTFVPGNASAPGVTYDLTGAPAQIQFGNGYATTYSRDSRYRLSRIQTSGTGGTPQDLRYSYDENGNPIEVNDAAHADDATYAYDFDNRLTSMYLNGSATPTASYAYGDPSSGGLGGRIGNMTSKTEDAGASAMTYSAEHAHAPATFNGGGLVYDRNGNLRYSMWVESEMFNAANRLGSSINLLGVGWQSDYQYDGSGELVRRRWTSSTYPNSMDTTQLFADGIYEERYDGCTSTATVASKYYMAFGRVIASNAVATSGTILTYYLADSLGSTVGTLSATAGNTTVRYFPFGKTRVTGGAPERGFTGQQQESGGTIGMYYYHARFYSTLTAHFVSADSSNGSGINRYAYVENNPLRYSDPSGQCVQDSGGNWLPCGRDVMAQFFQCAWGGTCAGGDDVRAYARGVVNTDAFKYFVGLESAARGDIMLTFEATGSIHDAVRYIDKILGVDTGGIEVGDFRLWFKVNATRRTIVDRGIEFHPGGGITIPIIKTSCVWLVCVSYPSTTRIFAGWKGAPKFGGGQDDPFVDLHLDAGPEGSFLGNPFSLARDINGVGVKIRWHAEFDQNGNLNVDEVQLDRVGGYDIPGIDLLGFDDLQTRSTAE